MLQLIQDSKKIAEWKTDLVAPLPWESEEDEFGPTGPAEWDDEDEAAAWAAATAAVGG